MGEIVLGNKHQGYQYLTIDQQIEHFKGCVYISDTHRILIPDGSLLNEKQFKSKFGGYDFAIDTMNTKPTKNAWKAFVGSRGVFFPKVSTYTFRPELEPGLIFEEEGRSVVNTFQPCFVRRLKDDPKPFTDHMHKLFPDDGDRAIIMAYMAACVQYIGTKFRWAPVVQGVQGNGKSLIMECISNAIGERLSHFPNPNDIANKFDAWIRFNIWIEGKVFIGIEEIDVKKGFDGINRLKGLIVDDDVSIEARRKNSYMGDNRANFFLCTNRRDAIKITDNYRHFCIFFTPQQKDADLIRDGMGEPYFDNLYNWLEKDGYAIVAEYLATYPIPYELNPAELSIRAPITTSTMRAIEAWKGCE